MDLTHGYRSFPFLFFTAALYLKALRSVNIKAAYYAMSEAIGGEKPLVNPLGLFRGLLCPVLHHIRPESLFIISSPDAAACLDETMEKASELIWLNQERRE